MRSVWWLRQARVSWTFPGNGHQVQWHCHSLHWSTACHPDSRRWPLFQTWCHCHPLQSQFCHRWALPHINICVADIAWAGYQSCSDVTAPVLDPQSGQGALDGVAADATTSDNTGIPAKCLEDIMHNIKDQEIGLFHVNMETFTSHSTLPNLDLGDTVLLGVRDEHWEAPKAHHCRTRANVLTAAGWRAHS